MATPSADVRRRSEQTLQVAAKLRIATEALEQQTDRALLAITRWGAMPTRRRQDIPRHP